MGKLFEKFGAEEKKKLLESAVEIKDASMVMLPDESLDAIAGGAVVISHGKVYELPEVCPECGDKLVFIGDEESSDWALFCPRCGGSPVDGWWNYK